MPFEEPSQQLKAFVLMPFDEEFKNVFDKLIVPALDAAGYDVKRADSDLDQQNVLKDVVRGIAHADLVVAELTSRNPNVLYELGLSHALRRNTILITQSMEDIPFDLRTYRVIQYSTQFDTAEELSSQLKAVGEAHQQGQIDFGSPISDFLPDHESQVVAENQELDSKKNSPVIDESVPEDESDGYLDAILAIQRADGQITKRLIAIGESTEKIGEEFEKSTQEVDELPGAGGAGMAVKAHRIASQMGDALDVYAAELSAEGPLLEADIEELISGGLTFTKWLADQEDVDVEQATAHRDSLAKLGGVSHEGIQSLAGFRQTLVGLSGISRDMARGAGRSITALDRIAGALEQVEAFTRKATDLLDEKLPSHPSIETGPENQDNQCPG